jgi:ribosomal protein S27AE
MSSLSQLLSCRPSIQRPNCPNCQTEMALGRVMPTRSNLDLRTFECGKCNRTEKVVVAADPINSYTLGWFLSELRPPK